jgi:hypothetical protein
LTTSTLRRTSKPCSSMCDSARSPASMSRPRCALQLLLN